MQGQPSLFARVQDRLLAGAKALAWVPRPGASDAAVAKAGSKSFGGRLVGGGIADWAQVRRCGDLLPPLRRISLASSNSLDTAPTVYAAKNKWQEGHEYRPDLSPPGQHETHFVQILLRVCPAGADRPRLIFGKRLRLSRTATHICANERPAPSPPTALGPAN